MIDINTAERFANPLVIRQVVRPAEWSGRQGLRPISLTIGPGGRASCAAEVAERYSIVWPAGTRWDVVAAAVLTPQGESLGVGEEVLGGGGYLSVDDVDRIAGSDAADLARESVDNASGGIAVVNNSDSAIGRP